MNIHDAGDEFIEAVNKGAERDVGVEKGHATRSFNHVSPSRTSPPATPELKHDKEPPQGPTLGDGGSVGDEATQDYARALREALTRRTAFNRAAKGRDGPELGRG